MDTLRFYEDEDCTAELTPDESTVTASGYVGDHLPGLAIGGNRGTYWSSEPDDSVWLEVDFTVAVEVKCVKFSDVSRYSKDVLVQAYSYNAENPNASLWQDVLMYDQVAWSNQHIGVDSGLITLLIDDVNNPPESNKWRIRADR